MLACHHLSQKSPQAITRLVFHREAHLGQFLLHLVVHIHVPLLRLDGDEVVAFPKVAAHLVRGMGVNGGLVLGHDALDQIVGMGTGKARLGDGFAHFGGELEAKAALMVLKPALGTGAQSGLKDHQSGLGLQFSAEVGEAVAKARLTRAHANDLVKRIMAKYQPTIDSHTAHKMGGDFRECYNLVTVQPQKWYMDMYDKVKKELTQMGLPMEY